MIRRLLTACIATLVCACGTTPTDPDVCLGRNAGDVVITEVMIDPESTDTGGEWIEIFNTLGTPLEMKGLTVYVRDTDGSGSKTHNIRAGTANARGYFVMGDIRSGPNPAWVNYSYADALGSMGNSRGVVGVRCGTKVLAEYTYNVAASSARSRMLDGLGDPTATAASSEASYCDAPSTTSKYLGMNVGTPGAANPRCSTVTTVTCDSNAAGHKAGDLIVTEFMADPDGTDTGSEWIEVYNTLDTPVDLKDLTLYFKDTDGTGLKKHVMGNSLVGAKGYFVVGDVRSGANPAWVNYSYGADLGALGNSRGVVGLECNGITVTERSYTAPVKSARSRMLNGGLGTPSTTLSAAESNYCDAPAGTVYFGNNTGSPGAANATCVPEAMVGTCIENGVARAITVPRAGDLLITEVMAAPAAASDTTGEWIELLAQAEVDLNDLSISSTTSSTRFSSMNCVHVQAGEYVLLARSADTFVNGDLPEPKAVYTSLSLSDTSNQRLTLSRGDAGIDSISIYPSSSGKSWQLDSQKLDSVSNDDPNNFCKPTLKWHTDGGGDFGSPGAPNEICPFIDAGMTVDGGSVAADQCIDAVTQLPRSIRVPPIGDLVITEWMPNPNAVADSAGEWFELLSKSESDLNGVTLQVGTTKTVLSSANCMAAAANSYLVFGKNTASTSNGNLPALTAVFGGGLTDSAQTISVLGADGGVYDTLSYAGATAGASTQVGSGFENPTDNDNTAHQCVTPTTLRYGPIGADGGATGDRGTPGLANIACP